MHRTPNWTELRKKNSELGDNQGKRPKWKYRERNQRIRVEENRVKEKYYDMYGIGKSQGEGITKKKLFKEMRAQNFSN